MVNYTSMKTVYTTNTSVTSKSYTCQKDTTAIVMFLGSTYNGSGSVKLNDTTLSSISGSSGARYMNILNLKQCLPKAQILNQAQHKKTPNSFHLHKYQQDLMLKNQHLQAPWYKHHKDHHECFLSQ